MLSSPAKAGDPVRRGRPWKSEVPGVLDAPPFAGHDDSRRWCRRALARAQPLQKSRQIIVNVIDTGVIAAFQLQSSRTTFFEPSGTTSTVVMPI